MRRDFSIGDIRFSADAPPVVIAEVGINHEGSLTKALRLVDAAVEAGCPIIKFQCHIPDMEMVPTDMTPGDISPDRLWDIIARCTLNEAQERTVQAHCRRRGILYLSTPFSREAADRLEAMDVPAFKIGSGECNSLPLIDHIARKGRPMIVSTGMNDIAQVQKTVEVIRRHDVPFMLMHCTSMYPTPYDKVRLGGIADLQAAFPDVHIGLSDHSMGIWTCLGATALGAVALEKHFTISRSWPGPDVPLSIEPNELADLVTGSRAVWQARGGAKTILPEEQPVIDFAYASVVSIRPIAAGETFSLDNIWVKRPGTGALHARRLDDVIGRTASRDIAPDVALDVADVTGLTA